VRGGRRRWRAAAVVTGVVVDAVVGEPSLAPHPLSAFGAAMRRLESGLWRDSRLAGVAHALGGVGLGVTAGRWLERAGPLGTAAAVYLGVGGRSLSEAAEAVRRALDEGDLDTARELLPTLVGREPDRLDDKEIARAVVESVAENTVDAVVAPLWWGLVAGAPGALGYRAANTLDAMVGHRSARYRRYGWASARVDDVAGFVPARITALLVAVVRPGAAPAVWRAVRRDAPAHPSPNAGVAEAAFAAALGLRLGGENRYGDRVELRPALGDGVPPQSDDIGAAVALSRRVTAAAAVLTALFGVGRGWRR
jgi:adenosylcobinamide-phosphate synthase